MIISGSVDSSQAWRAMLADALDHEADLLAAAKGWPRESAEDLIAVHAAPEVAVRGFPPVEAGLRVANWLRAAGEIPGALQ